MDRTPKILVEVTELDKNVYFKRFPIVNGQVPISTKGGRGNKAEAPPLPKTMYKQKRYFGLIEKRYARYRRGSNRFMHTTDPDLPPLSLALIEDWTNNRVFTSYFGDKAIQGIFYLLVVLGAFSVLLGVLPYIR